MSDLFSTEMSGGFLPKNALQLLEELNPVQAGAASHVEGPLLIIAGAGSGKTRVLTYRIAYLLASEKAKAYQILALTFTNKAAQEMRSRIGSLIGSDSADLWMGTFHSIFARILRTEAINIGYGNDYTIYDSDDSEKVVKGIIQELKMDIKEVKPSIIRNKISSAKNQLITPQDYANNFIQSSLDDIVAQVYKIYNERLKQSNSMDFDDLLIKPIELFEQNPEILNKYQKRFQYILIDEYQDTNQAQYKVTKLLASSHKNICVVGDDAQSIYSFRGADISNILNFESDYPSSTRIALEQNYRSTKAILRCADSIIKNNQKQLEKTLWTDNQPGKPVTLLDNFNEREEANRISGYIQQMKLKQDHKNNDFAILYRTNYQSRVFEDALRKRDIKYQLVGGVSFYQRKEVKDVLAYMRLLVNPSDEESLLRVINEPARGIGLKTIDTIKNAARAQKGTIWSILTDKKVLEEVYKPAVSRISEFTEVITEAKKMLSSTPLSEITRFILEKTGYIKQFIEENTHESLGRRENVLELINYISYFEKSDENATLSQFLQEVSLFSEVDNLDENLPAVTLMTIHAAKGLEFPVVFIAGLEEELFPIGGRNGEDADIEEERRLFYVAITRAKQELFFSFARSRYRFGEEKSQMRSRFLDEVDPGVVRTESGATIQQRSNSSSKTASGSSYVSYDQQYNQSFKPAYLSKKTKPSDSQINYEPTDASNLVPGTRVIHDSFGSGKIINREGSGEKTTVVVFFQSHGQKKLLLKFAKLRILL